MRPFALLITFAIAFPAPSMEKPNIVFIIVDDMGPFDLGCYGSKKLHTPNLDRMASGGMRFTQAYSGCCVCAPARCTLMTGYDMRKASVRGNSGGISLLDRDLTIAEVLAKGGYISGGFGKWGLGDIDTPGVPEKNGFSRFYGYYHQIHAHYYFPDYLIDTGKKFYFPSNRDFYQEGRGRGGVPRFHPKTGRQHVYSAYRIVDQMLHFIRENKDRRFFCYAPWSVPHGPYEIPDDDPSWQRYKDKPWTMKEKVHAAFCTLVDRHVGETLDLLEDLKLTEKTIVVFCSDNGVSFQTKNLDSGGSLRGIKGSLYEGGIRAPFLVQWPGQIRPGSVSNLPVYFPDVLPTLAELAGVKQWLPKNIHGISLAPELLGKKKLSRNRQMYWEWNGSHFFKKYIPHQQALRNGNWKLVRHKNGAPWELYDLSKDESEKVNLAAKYPDRVKAMAKAINETRAPHREQKEPKMPKGRKYR